MLRSKLDPMNKMSFSHWQQLYSKVFVLAILAALLLVMGKSLKSGLVRFDDNFPGKARLIATFNHLRYSLGDRVFPQVLVGREGWLEFWAQSNLNDYQNAFVVPEKLERTHRKLELLNKELLRRGITLIVVVAPNKATIYPDKLPGKIEKINKQSRLDILLELMSQTDSSYLLDIRPALMEDSQSHQLYYKTDTHWTARGAYIAYREIMTAVSQTYPDLLPYQLDQFKWKNSKPMIKDLARLLGVDFLREQSQQAQPKFEVTSYFQRFSPRPGLPGITMSWGYGGQEKTLVMYHDSFGKRLHQFFFLQFKTAMYIPNRDPSQTPWINVMKPDIVIIEVVERDMAYLDVLLSKLLKQLAQQN
jgi:hypothetical protein